MIHSDYILYRNDCVSRGGGVFIAVHTSIPSSLVCAPPDLEIVAIKLSSSDIILCTVYIPPVCNESYLLSIIQHLSELICSHHNCIIVGDFTSRIFIGHLSPVLLIFLTTYVTLSLIITSLSMY